MMCGDGVVSGLSTVSVYIISPQRPKSASEATDDKREKMRQLIGGGGCCCCCCCFCLTDLRPDMPEIDPQLLQQRWLAVIAFCAERGQPARPQPALLAHSPTDGRSGGAEGCPGGAADPDPITRVGCRCWVGGRAVPAVGCLGGRGVAGDVPGRAVGGWVELEVLR